MEKSVASSETERGHNERSAEKAHDAFVRWQQLTVAHLGHTINLILTLTTAAFGFVISLAINDKISPGSPGNCAFLWSAGFLVAAIAVGLFANFSRLLNFRRTAQVARGREMQALANTGKNLTVKQQTQAEQRDGLRKAADWWGNLTWWLLRFQTAGFVLGVGLLSYAVWLNYWHR